MRKQSLDFGLAPSAIRALFEYGRRRKAEVGEEKVYDFSIGNPCSPTPTIVNETLVRLLNDPQADNYHKYTSGAGDEKVRASIAKYLNKTYNADLDGSLIYLTCGAAAGLTIALNALINKGDEVILFVPYFQEYRVFVEFAGGIVKTVKPNFQTFEPDLEEFSKAINEKTTMVIINSPNNPSGVIYKEETLIAMASILKEKEKEFGHPIYLLSDEPYREIIHEDTPYPFPLNHYEDSIQAYSFSKCLSIPGERIGYLVVNKKLKDAKNAFAAICGAGRALGYVCAPSLFQRMIPECLGVTADTSLYRRNRDLLYNGLVKMGYEPVYPQGAFYLLLKSLEEDSYAFSEKAKSLDLLLVPCDPFGLQGYVRIAYCVETRVIENSLPVFKRLKELYGD